MPVHEEGLLLCFLLLLNFLAAKHTWDVYPLQAQPLETVHGCPVVVGTAPSLAPPWLCGTARAHNVRGVVRV